MSRTFSTNSGSVDSLKVSLRCGCSENAFQIRCTVDGAKPDARAIPRDVKCVRPVGSVSSVAVTTSATFWSVTVRGAPGRGSSSKPSSRFSAKRLRQVAAVTRVMPSRSAIARLLAPHGDLDRDLVRRRQDAQHVQRALKNDATPRAASSTISARIASACATLRRRNREASSTASISDNSIRTAFGAAVHVIPATQCTHRNHIEPRVARERLINTSH